MSEGEHDLVVHYVAPSPTWRVSYRLVAETDENGETGTALLQGWGLFDNRLEEDLNDVQVTLVAGQPISFIYDLYASKIPERPVVKDEARVVQAPVEYRSEIDAGEVLMAFRDESPRSGSSTVLANRARRVEKGYKQLGMSRSDVQQSTAINTETRDTGETFQYVVNTPVTVKRGESALVPIIGHDVSYQHELLYNKDKLTTHPVASMRFENQSGLTLERGPVTLVEDGDYKGEAIIPFTKDNNSVYVPYAVELGVVIKEAITSDTVLRGISIEKAYAQFQNQQIRITTYIIENTTDSDKTVTIETPIDGNWSLYETPVPDNKTLEHQRWKVNAPAKSTATFERKEQYISYNSQELRSIQYIDLARWLENEFIDDSLIDDLRDLLKVVDSIEAIRDIISGNDIERSNIYEKQEQLRKNMSALSTSGEEGELRQRVVAQLRESQDRLEAIEQNTKDLNTQIKETEEKITAMIAELGKKYGDND